MRNPTFRYASFTLILTLLFICLVSLRATEISGLTSSTNSAVAAQELWGGTTPPQAVTSFTLADLERHVQAEQWTNAMAIVDVLLKDKPDDATLKEYQAEIVKHLPTPTTTPSMDTAPMVEAENMLKGQDRLDWNTLTLAVNDIVNAKDADTRAKAAAEYMDKSLTFVAKHPAFVKAWQYRALAALELGKVAEGSEAGLKLKSFGALDSDDPAMMTLMANLNRKGWLDKAQVEKISAQAMILEAAKLRRAWWQGSWDEKIGSDTRTLSIDTTHVTYAYNSFFASSHSTSQTRYTIPGDAAYTFNYDYNDAYTHVQKNDSGSGHVELLSLKLSDDAHLLTFESRGSINVSGDDGNSVQSLDGLYGFYYEPALKDALLQLSADDLKLPPDELQKKAQAMLLNPTNATGLVYERQTPSPVAGGHEEMLKALAAVGDQLAVSIEKSMEEQESERIKAARQEEERLKIEKDKQAQLDVKYQHIEDLISHEPRTISDLKLELLRVGGWGRQHSFWAGRTEVTQFQYQSVMGENPSEQTNEDFPVNGVTWEQATNFCSKLTERERMAGRLPKGFIYCLPTNEQWGHLADAGIATHDILLSGAWFAGDADFHKNLFGSYGFYGYLNGTSELKLHGVALKVPNRWGLYDVFGNVQEWCSDEYFAKDDAKSGNGFYHVTRGGCYMSDADTCLKQTDYQRSAAIILKYRVAEDKYVEHQTIGFRVILAYIND